MKNLLNSPDNERNLYYELLILIIIRTKLYKARVITNIAESYGDVFKSLISNDIGREIIKFIENNISKKFPDAMRSEIDSIIQKTKDAEQGNPYALLRLKKFIKHIEI